MTAIPANEVTQQDIEEWYKLAVQLAKVKLSEKLLRDKIFAGKFPDPVEGSKNKFALGGGYILQATHTINREIDPGALEAIKEQLKAASINADELIERKPTLKVGKYKALTDEQKKIFDLCLNVKPGSPALKIVKPKVKGEDGNSDETEET